MLQSVKNYNGLYNPMDISRYLDAEFEKKSKFWKAVEYLIGDPLISTHILVKLLEKGTYVFNLQKDKSQ